MGLCKDCKYFTEVSRPRCIGFDNKPVFEGKKIGVCSCSKFVYLWSDRLLVGLRDDELYLILSALRVHLKDVREAQSALSCSHPSVVHLIS